MKDILLKHFANIAAKKSGSWAKIASFHNGVPQIDAIKTKIEAAGFIVEYTDVKGGAWAKIYKPYTAQERAQCKPEATDADCRYLVAQGVSRDRDDALLQAVFGAVREEEAAKAVDDAIKTAGYKVDAALRQKLESRYILEGGAARLALDLEAFSKVQGV